MNAVRLLTALSLPLSFLVLRAADTAPGVDEIVAKNTEARGGLDKLRAIQTRKLVGTADINGSMQGQITIQVKRPNLFRMDMTLPQGALVEGFDGTDAWGVNPFAGSTAPEKHDAAETRVVGDNADIDGALVDYKAKGTKVELLGAEDVAGSPAYKLKVTTKAGTLSTVWIDQKTWQMTKMVQTRERNGQEVEVTSLFSNYKPVDGVMMPMTVEQQFGPVTMKFEMTSAKTNEPIDDAIFHMPAETPAAQSAPGTQK